MGMDESSAPRSAETAGQGQVAAFSKYVTKEFKWGLIAEAPWSSPVDGAICIEGKV